MRTHFASVSIIPFKMEGNVQSECRPKQVGLKMNRKRLKGGRFSVGR